MLVLARSSTASEPMRLLLLALLAGAAAGGSVCDLAVCGRGSCTELPDPEQVPLPPRIPRYECNCDPGWSQLMPSLISPCIVPNCSFDSACLNLRAQATENLCAFVSCGAGGACKPGDIPEISYTCECQPGYANLLNQTAMPCVKDCFFGEGCSALGLAPASAPPPSPEPIAGDQDSSGSSAPPSGTKGSVPSRRLLQLLLLVTLAMAQVM